MKRNNLNTNNFYTALKCMVFIILVCFGSIAKAQEQGLTVISNQDGSPAQLKFTELRSIFMGEKQRWHSGTKITIALMRTNTSVGKNTSQKIYDMSGDELNKFWLALVFQGKARRLCFLTHPQNWKVMLLKTREQ